jgi:hypothetical protein
MRTITATLLCSLFLFSSCSISTSFPATRAEKRAYKKSQDVDTPRELDLDRESGLGGGEK